MNRFCAAEIPYGSPERYWDEDSNCLGYALNVKRWFSIKGWRAMDNKAIAKQFQEVFNLKPVKKSDMKLGKNYVALRFTLYKGDYHFIWRGKKGHWRHKMGGGHPHAISQKKVFSKKWHALWDKYIGHIYLYEYDRNNVSQFL